MTATYRYIDQAGAFDTDLGNQRVRLGELPGFSGSAETGQPAGATVVLDDAEGTLSIVGHKLFAMDEGAAPSGNRRVYIGLISDRNYRRGDDSLRLGAARKIDLTLYDLNALLALREITGDDGVRPAETAGERLTWIIGSDYLSDLVADTGYVVYPGHAMDAVDYRGQSPNEVLADCALQVDYNWWVGWDEATSQPFLWYDARTSLTYTTTTRVSNVLSDYDGATTFSGFNAILHRSPQRVYSGVYVPYSRGAVYQTDPAIAAAFIARDGNAPNSNVSSEVAAGAVASSFLATSATEADTITCSVEVPAAHVNDIRQGHLMEARFSHLATEGYGEFSQMRVSKRTVRQQKKTPDKYWLDLELAPGPSAPTCDDAVDVNALHGTVTGSVAAESGSPTPTWAHATIPGWFGSPEDDPVTLIPFVDVTNANDGDVDTSSLLAAQNIRYSGCVAAYWTSDLGDTYSVCTVKGTNAFSGTQLASRPPTTIDYSDDGISWTQASYSLTYTEPIAPQYWVASLSAPVAARYWRLRYLWCGTGGVAGLWIAPGWNNNGTRVWDWQILADPDPV